MAAFYQKFLRRHLDLSSLSVMRREDNDPYFCTPKGASIFGWAGVDGIHFCFVRGFGETVFAVSPMNGGRDCVHVIARDFSDFLRLLLATGDSAALEQAWQWDEAQFDAFLAENPPTDEQKAVLSQISTVFSLTPMERPWQYLRKLQAEFDLSKLKFTEDFYDPEMNGDAPEQKTDWKVYFDGSFWGHHGASARAGKCLYKSGFRGRGATGSRRRFTFVQRALSLIFVCARRLPRCAALWKSGGSIPKATSPSTSRATNANRWSASTRSASVLPPASP
mgnify:CR=1 FL=1